MYAVASLLYTPDYLPGALVLGHRLRQILPPNTELVLLIDLPRFSVRHRALLGEVWHKLVDVGVIRSLLEKQLVHDLKRPELALTYTKIHLWALDYEKVLYLDADTLPVADAGPSVVDILQLPFSRGTILAAPDSGFPDVFNSGVFGLTPDPADYANLVALAASNDPAVSFDGADQGLLNQYFNGNPDWVALLLENKLPLSRWIPIPFLYNTTPTAQYEYLPAYNYFSPHRAASPEPPRTGLPQNEADAVAGTLAAYGNAAARYFGGAGPRVKLVHFIGPIKPWKGLATGIFRKWWDAWFAYSRGLSIHQKLADQVYSVSIKPLYAPGQEPEVPPRKYTARDLCDPANYQQFSSALVSTSAWDATVEQPPRTRPVSSFSADISQYESQWDDTEQSIEHETEEDNSEEQLVELAEKEEEEETKLPGLQLEPLAPVPDQEHYGYHANQVAERVFDKKSNYNPSHSLLRVLGTEPQKQVTVPDVASLSISPKKDAPEEKQAKSLSVVSEALSVYSKPVATLLSPSEAPKLFPWEFKGDYQPERVFN